MVKSLSRKQSVVNKFKKAFIATAEEYDAANRRAIEEPMSWQPGGFGTTHRASGETVVGDNRNIVDTGSLRDSQQLEYVTPYLARLSWDGGGHTPAVIVHEGATFENGSVMPARPWTEIAANETNLGEVFAGEFNGG